MSLQRNEHDNMSNSQKSSIADQLHLQTSHQMKHQNPQTIQEEIPNTEYWKMTEQLWQHIQTLREDNLKDAEEKLQLTAYLTMTEEISSVLMTFMSDMQGDIKTLKDEQLKLLSLQRIYAEKIGTEIDNLIYKTYETTKEQFSDMIENELKTSTENFQKIMQSLKNTADYCTETSKNARAEHSHLHKIDCIGKLLYYAAPIFILLDIVIRIIYH